MADPLFPGLRKGYTEVKSTTGKPSTNVFFKFDDKIPGGLPKHPKVKTGGIQAKTAKIGTRGLSWFQLFATLHVEEKGNNQFDFAISDASVDSSIEIMPKSDFQKLSDFGGIYAEFAETATYGSGWRPAADKFAEKWVTTEKKNHWVTGFHGIMPKTVRHELEHVKFAIQESEGVLYNLTNECRTAGKLGGSASPEEKVQKFIDGLIAWNGFPYFDVASKQHKAIAMRDCLFMVGWYEKYHLDLDVMSNAGYEAMLAALYDQTLHDTMKKLGETFPWVPK